MDKGIFSQLKAFLADVTGKNRFTNYDFVILKTMLMLAAVDGDISEKEVEAFRALAAKSRGCCGESFDALWSSALYSAGYLLLQSRFLGRDALVKEFVREAEKDFVGEIAMDLAEERQHAFDSLVAMASADGTYSDVERACIEALAEHVRKTRDLAIAERFPRAVMFDN